MFPDFAYTMVPGTSANGSSGTMTTFDGVGVRADARISGAAGTGAACPAAERQVPVADRQRHDRDDEQPDDRQDRRDRRPARQQAVRVAGEPRRPGADAVHASAAGHAVPPGTGAAMTRPDGRRARSGRRPARAPRRARAWVPDADDVADLQLQRLESAERPARKAGDDVHAVALRQRRRQVRAAEGDAVEDVALTTQDELGVAAVGGPDALHGEPEDGHERLGVPGAAGCEARQVPEQRVVDVGGRAARGPRRAPSAGLPGTAAPPAPGTARRTRPSDRPAARSRPRRRGHHAG